MRTVAAATLRRARGAVVGVDVTDGAELDGGAAWVAAVRASAPPGCAVVAVGCRTELAARREIDAGAAAAHFGALQPPVPYIEDDAADPAALGDTLVRMLLADATDLPPAPWPLVTNENADIPPEDSSNHSGKNSSCTIC